MGLFGYNKKKFYKNTELFKGELTELKSAADDWEMGNLLDEAMRSLDFGVYPEKADPKELEAIDKRIQTLIGKVREYIASRKTRGALEYGKLLLSAFVDARAKGKERYTPEGLQLREEKARLYGVIFELLLRREAIERERQKLIEACFGIDKTSAKYQRNRSAWKQLGMEADQLNAEIQFAQKEYNTIRARIQELDRIIIEYLPPSLMGVNMQSFYDTVSERMNEANARDAPDEIECSHDAADVDDGFSAGIAADGFRREDTEKVAKEDDDPQK